MNSIQRLLLITFIITLLFARLAPAQTYTSDDKLPPLSESKNKSDLSKQQSINSDDSFKTYAEAYQSTHDQIIAEFYRAREKNQEIATHFVHINEITSKINSIYKKYKYEEAENKINELQLRSKHTELTNEYSTEFPFLYANVKLFYDDQQSKINKDFVYLTNPAKITKAIDTIIELYRGSYPVICFKNKMFNPSKKCDVFKKHCSDTWQYGVENNQLYFNELTDDYEVDKISVDVEIDKPISTQSKELTFGIGSLIQNEDSQLFCQLLAFTSTSLKPKGFRKVPDYNNNPFAKLISIIDIFPYPEGFQKDCLDDQPSKSAVQNLLKLNIMRPKEYVVSSAYKQYNKWLKSCRKASYELCRDTYVVKDTVILSYLTVACQVRDVTEKDVQHDMEYMPTEAERLNHATLLDKIQICQKAKEADYFWPYIRPTSSGCKKSKQ